MNAEPSRVKTKNGCGWTSHLTNPITDMMLRFAGESQGRRVLDVGAAFGVATLPALRVGATVVANDIEPEHLTHIAEEARRQGLAERLALLLGRFPETEIPGEFDAVHCSNVLHFMRGTVLTDAVRCAHRILKPGGRIFIQVGSPYAGHLRSFLPTFEKRLAIGLTWPGEIENARSVVDPPLRDETPEFLHALDRETLTRTLEASGFAVSLAKYYTRPGLPEICRSDGRENLGIVGAKR